VRTDRRLGAVSGPLNGVNGGMQIISSAQPLDACGGGSEAAPSGLRG
jgi:hypothetical protein